MRWQDFAWFANSERIYPPLVVWNFLYLILIAIFDALPVELSDPEWTELQSCRRQRKFESVVANRSVCFCGEIYERCEIQNLAPQVALTSCLVMRFVRRFESYPIWLCFGHVCHTSLFPRLRFAGRQC